MTPKPAQRDKPLCGKCGQRHWHMVPCENAADRNRVEEHNKRRRREARIDRPREGYRDYGDQLGDFERAGTLNGALILRRRERERGEQVGSLRR